MNTIAVLITCEHGGNRIPARYAHLFHGHAALLRSHRGYDAGSLRIARALSEVLRAPLHASTVSRLLIDLNRSPDQADLYSELTGALPEQIQAEILQSHYLPYRNKVQADVARMLTSDACVLHVSCHSFAPELNGEARDADVGLLYDPLRKMEAAFCRRWRAALARRAPSLIVRMNYPYLGAADGLTTSLRRAHVERYAGIELEINQKHVRHGGSHWAQLRRALALALQDALSSRTTTE